MLMEWKECRGNVYEIQEKFLTQCLRNVSGMQK